VCGLPFVVQSTGTEAVLRDPGLENALNPGRFDTWSYFRNLGQVSRTLRSEVTEIFWKNVVVHFDFGSLGFCGLGYWLSSKKIPVPVPLQHSHGLRPVTRLHARKLKLRSQTLGDYTRHVTTVHLTRWHDGRISSESQEVMETFNNDASWLLDILNQHNSKTLKKVTMELRLNVDGTLEEPMINWLIESMAPLEILHSTELDVRILPQGWKHFEIENHVLETYMTNLKAECKSAFSEKKSIMAIPTTILRKIFSNIFEDQSPTSENCATLYNLLLTNRLISYQARTFFTQSHLNPLYLTFRHRNLLSPDTGEETNALIEFLWAGMSISTYPERFLKGVMNQAQIIHFTYTPTLFKRLTSSNDKGKYQEVQGQEEEEQEQEDKNTRLINIITTTASTQDVIVEIDLPSIGFRANDYGDNSDWENALKSCLRPFENLRRTRLDTRLIGRDGDPVTYFRWSDIGKYLKNLKEDSRKLD
jgi:hypothetical protein